MTTWLKTKNNASSALVSSITSGATSLGVLAGEGARFPSTFPYRITIEDEILEVTGRTGDVLTVTRAAESTIAASHPSNASVRLNVTSGILEQVQSEIDLRQLSSLLSEQGSVPYRDASAWGELLHGAAGQVLQSGGHGANPSWVDKLSSKVIYINRDLTLASGNVSYTGVGFKPTAIIAFTIAYEGSVGASWGGSDSSKNSYCVVRIDTGMMWTIATLVDAYAATGAYQVATVFSYDADGFTLSWVKTGSPTGTAKVICFCLK